MYVTTILLSFLTVTFSYLLASLPQRKIRQIATTKKEKENDFKMIRFATVLALVGLVASLTLDERMDWAAEDAKGMYSRSDTMKLKLFGIQI